MNPFMQFLGGLGNQIQQGAESFVKSVQSFRPQAPTIKPPQFTLPKMTMVSPTIAVPQFNFQALANKLRPVVNDISENPSKYNLFSQLAQKKLPTGIGALDTVGQGAGNVGNFILSIPQAIPRFGYQAAQQLARDNTPYQPKGFERAVFGGDPLKSFTQQGKDIAPYVGGNAQLGTGLAFGLGVADLLPFGGGKGKAISKLDDLAEVGAKGLRALGGKERLNFLLGWDQTLLKKGFAPAQIDKLDPARAYAIIKNNISPKDLANDLKSFATKAVEQNSWEASKGAFADWINQRRASAIAGLSKSHEFVDLDSKGLGGILEFQAGDKAGSFKKVKDYFDKTYSHLQDSNISFNYKNDYLPQLWAQAPEAVQEILGRRLGTRPSFTLESVIKNYQQGLELGLTPKFKTISELVGWYEQKARKATADKEFFDFLKGRNFIVPEDAAPNSWVTLDPDRFPKISTKIGSDIYSGFYKAEPQLAAAINNYLKEPTGALSTFANVVTRIKNLGLAGGIPNTAINYHGAVNIFRRDLMAAKNPIANFVRDIKWIVHPDSADAFVKANLDDANFFVKHGLTITSEDWKRFSPEMPKSGFEKFEAKWESLFGSATFDKYLPAIKLSFAKGQFDELVKVMSPEDAARKASEISNNIFGGINIDALGRSKDTQNLLRSLLLAPDWLETQFRTGAGVAKGIFKLSDPQYKAYRTIARNIFLFYVLENVANKVMSGHWMFENEGTANKFRIDTGTYDSTGQHRYLQSWGTAQDFIRLPAEAILNIAQGKPVEAIINPVVNRVSMPVSAGMHLLTNQDYLHRPIYGGDIPASQQMGGIANEIAQGFGVPVQIRSAVDYATGKSSGEEALANALELPIRYSGTKKSELAKPYFDLKDKLETGFTPEQQKVADYLTLADEKGGADSKQTAQILLSQPWAFTYFRDLKRLDKTDPLWNRSDEDIKAFLAYQISENPNKAAIRAKYPFIPTLQFQRAENYYKFAQSEIAKAKAEGKEPDQNYLNAQAPKKAPMQRLTPQGVQIVSTYTSLPQGSQGRKQLLAQYPWLKQFWNDQSEFYKQNPIENKSALAETLEQFGIFAKQMEQNGYAGLRGRKVKFSAKLPKIKKPKVSKLKIKAPKVSFKPLKIKKLTMPKTKKLSYA